MPIPNVMTANVSKFVLNNGLTVVIQPLSNLASVSVGLQIRTGSRDETEQEAGISHLIEHMLFQGTTKRDVRELSRVLTAVGGQLDACTGRESTVVYAKVPANHLELAIDVVSDMVSHPKISRVHLEKEKRVIEEEIGMYEDTPDEYIHDLFFQSLWGDHSLGRPILGTPQTLRHFEQKQLRDFIKRHYQPSRMVLAIAGQVTINNVMRIVKKYLESFKSATATAIEGPSVSDSCAKSIIKKRRLEQVHLCLGTTTYPYSDNRRLAMVAFSNIFGGGTNSRLFYEVREKRALCYSVYSYIDFYRDAGVVGIYAACHPDKLSKLVDVIKRERDRLIKQSITSIELNDIREQMQGNLKLSMESSSNHMWSMLQNEYYLEKHPSIKSVLKSINQLSKSTIKQVAKDIFNKKALAAVVLGPVKGSVNSLKQQLFN